MKAIDNRTGAVVAYKTLSANIRRATEAGSAGKTWADDLEKNGIAVEVGWETARDRFVAEYMQNLSADYRRQWKTVANKISALPERDPKAEPNEQGTTKPETIYDFTASWVSEFTATMQDTDIAASSIRAYLRVLKVFLKKFVAKCWPAYKCPEITFPPVGDDMKGRPICGEELDRILKKLPKVVSKQHAAGWKFTTRGLYLSGLRRKEALKLRWDAPTGQEFHVRYLGSRARKPVFVITAEDNKNRKARAVRQPCRPSPRRSAKRRTESSRAARNRERSQQAS